MKIKLLKSFLLLGAFLCFGIAEAQDVSGTVSDANGPLPGASVVVKGTTNGTQTDFDGNYTLNGVTSDAILVFSYIGFKTKETSVNGQATVNITMDEDASELDEVVVIGYGSTTIKDATGSVTAVTSDEFNSGVIASPEQLIQGKTAGVQISQSSGEPGAGISVRIRGSNSVRANNNPLFVVDGIPLDGQSTSPASGDLGFGGGDSSNPLSFLNPNDIESISVLKDASATAIYGSRGAAGVVIVTTKSGRGSRGGVWEFSSNLSISTPGNKYDLLNRDEFLDAVLNISPGTTRNAIDFGATTDWQDFVTRTTASTTNNLSFSQTYENGSVRATFGYSKQFGVIVNDDLERITGRINVSHRFFDDKLTLGVQGSISRLNDQDAPLSGGAGFRGDLLGAAYSANPTWPALASFDPVGAQIQPANLLANSLNVTNTDRVLLNGSAEYKFSSKLSAKVNFGYDKSEGENTSVLASSVNAIAGTTGFGQGSFNTLDVENRLLEATVNYTTEFEKSNLDILLGFSYQDFGRSGRNATGFGFSTTDLNLMSQQLRESVINTQNSIEGRFQQFFYTAASPDLIVNRLFPDVVTENIVGGGGGDVTALVADTFDFTDELQSFFGRVNYSISDKYLFTGTVRADGSSRFGPENQYGIFPSGAFAWKLSEEDFIGDNVSTLKLRLSAGLTGSQEGLGFGNFALRQRFGNLDISDGGDVTNSGVVPVAVDVPDLQWEETFTLNLGFDFGFNNDRFNGSFDIYRGKTTELLLTTPPAAPAAAPFNFGNVDASLINQGIELALEYDWVKTEDVTFTTSFNIAYNENEIQDFAGIIDLAPINGPGLTNAFAQRFEAGQSLNSYYTAIFTGFDANGLPTYQDLNGDGVGDPIQDREFVGEDALPDVTTGLTLNLRVKNWDFNTFFAGQFGFSVYNNTANAFFVGGNLAQSRNVTQDVAAGNEAAGASADVSTRFLEKGDFVRLQNASIGYNVPLNESGSLKNLRLSITGQNLLLFTGYSGLDPEVSSNTGNLNIAAIPSAGIDFGGFPRPTTVSFGINATF